MEIVGVSLLTFCADLLHALYLGPAQDFCAAAFWLCVRTNIFQLDQPNEAKVQLSVIRIRHLLWAWYKDQRAAHPEESITELENFTVPMIGTADAPVCKTKGAEAKALLFVAPASCGCTI